MHASFRHNGAAAGHGRQHQHHNHQHTQQGGQRRLFTGQAARRAPTAASAGNWVVVLSCLAVLALFTVGAYTANTVMKHTHEGTRRGTRGGGKLVTIGVDAASMSKKQKNTTLPARGASRASAYDHLGQAYPALVSTLFTGTTRWVPPEPASKVEAVLSLLAPERPPSSGFLSKYKNPCWRNQADRLRCLPSYYVIGMSKAGTTDVWQRLVAHPHISTTARLMKEPQFWTRLRPRSSLTHYLDSWQPNTDITEADPQIMFGDSSATTYTLTGMRWPHSGEEGDKGTEGVPVQQLLAAIQPASTKYVMILRDPVKRLYSSFKFYYEALKPKHMPRPSDYEPSSEYFHTYVTRQIASLRRCLVSSRGDALVKCIITSDTAQWPVFLANGLYVAWIQQWEAAMGSLSAPQPNFRVWRIEDYEEDGGAFMNSIYDFIGVAPLHGADMERVLGLRRRNATPKRVNELFGPMLNKTEHLLREFYRPWNARLATHLRDLGYLWAADDTAAAE